MPRILIADPDPATRRHLENVLRERGYETFSTEHGRQALQQLEDSEDVALLLAELELPDIDGKELVQEARRRNPEVAVILQTAFGTVEDAVAAMREGAADFLSKPFSDEQVGLAVERALERAALVRENQDLRAALDDRVRIDNLIADDARMQQILKTVKAVAQTRTTFLITGESGTGKTMLARAVHHLSSRRGGPFVEVNCGALPETLLESELFGHVRGAFTGAAKDRAGKFEVAHGGTIFLDEVGTSSPGFQVRLLRVLQDRVIERVGDSRPIPVDVRVILATNLDLAAAVRDKRFREDLYFRIHVVTVEMPPLRQRRGDVSQLAQHFLHRHCLEAGRRFDGFAPQALELLRSAPWPGNVRQLENVVERAVVLAEGPRIEVHDLPPELLQGAEAGPAEAATADPLAGIPPEGTLKDMLEQVERLLLRRALQRAGGNREQTAQKLAINRSTLFNKLRKYRLS
jgi:DNA-binding NtrC family response regulator